jgi:hypothetical protein
MGLWRAHGGSSASRGLATVGGGVRGLARPAAGALEFIPGQPRRMPFASMKHAIIKSNAGFA